MGKDIPQRCECAQPEKNSRGIFDRGIFDTFSLDSYATMVPKVLPTTPPRVAHLGRNHATESVWQP